MNYLLYIFLPVIIGVATKVLHELYLNATEFRRKAWIMGGLAALWIATVLILACFFCAYATTVEQCFLLWTIAFGVGCIAAGIQAFILIICRSKRDVSELNRMKLRDL